MDEQTALIGANASNLPQFPTLTVFTACLHLFAVNFVNYAFIPIIPDLLAQDHVNQDHYQEWTTILLGLWALIRAISGVAASAVVDVHGMRMLNAMALVAVALSAPPMFMRFGLTWLVFSRVLHGAASAAIMISCIFLVTVKVPRQDYGASMGWVALALALGCLFGSGCGGPLYEHTGAVGILVASEILLLVCFYLAMHDSGTFGEDATHVANPSEGDVISDNAENGNKEYESALTVMTRHMKKQISTFMFLARQPVVFVMFFSMIATCTTMACLEAVLPSFIHGAFGWSSTQASSMWLLQSVPQLSSPLAGALVDRYGARSNLRVGFTSVAFSLACMSFVQHNSVFEIGVFGTMTVLMSMGSLLVVIPSMASVSTAIDSATDNGQEQSEPGLAISQSSAILNLAMTVPGVIGPVWSSLAMEIGSWRILCLSLALLNAVALLSTIFQPPDMDK